MNKRCKIEGCNKKYYAKGFCQSHYRKDRYENDLDFKKHIKEYSEEYYVRNPGYAKKKSERFRERNPEYAKKRNREKRFEVIKAYGGKCEYCGEDHQEYLEIDHINGSVEKYPSGKRIGSALYALLKVRGWPKENHRLLCSNCNQCRSNFGDKIAKKLGKGIRENRR